MKNFFKKHGKKVSVGLLATALMISPMLASAAEACNDKKNVYIFLDALPMAIEETDYTTAKFSSYDDWENYIKDTTKHEYTRLDFSSQYLSLYGWDKSFLTTGTASATMPDGSSKNTVSYDCGTNSTVKYWCNYNQIVVAGLGDTDSTTEPLAGKDKSRNDLPYNNENLTSFASGLPENVVITEENKTNSWDKETTKAVVQLWKQNVDLAEKNDVDVKDLISYTDGDTTYYMHAKWGNKDGKLSDDATYVGYSRVKYIVTNPDKLGQSDLNNYENNYVDALYKSLLNSDATTDITMGLTGDKSKVLSEIKRNISPTTKIPTKSEGFEWLEIYYDYYLDSSNNVVWLGNEAAVNKAITDGQKVKHKSEYWAFLPATYEISYEGDCANTPIEENTGGDNVKTGVASYAIIGTLLVGAGSAYIYARKNNKFSKL